MRSGSNRLYYMQNSMIQWVRNDRESCALCTVIEQARETRLEDRFFRTDHTEKKVIEDMWKK